MRRCFLNHYFVGENEIVISLDKYFVSIKIIANNNSIRYEARIMNDDTHVIVFKFNSLDEAIVFIEDIVSESNDFSEMIEYYDMIKAMNEQDELIKVRKYN